MSLHGRQALQLLFGTDGPDLAPALAARGNDWVSRLRTAYRRRAHETHPDRAAVLGRHPEELVREFRRVKEAYELLRALPHAPALGPDAAPAPGHRAARARATTEAPPPRATRTGAPPPRATASDTTPPRATASDATPPRATGAPPPPRAEPATGRGHARAAGPRPGDPGTYDRRGRRADGAPPRPDDARRPGDPAPPRFHRGSVPQRELRFAEYLFYSGRIPWQALIDAVCWQRRQQPLIGRLAVRLGFLTAAEVQRILDRREREGATAQLFGQYALEHGYLTRFQLLALLGMQHRSRRRIGQFFVESGHFDEATLERLLAEQAAHARSHRRGR